MTIYFKSRDLVRHDNLFNSLLFSIIFISYLIFSGCKKSSVNPQTSAPKAIINTQTDRVHMSSGYLVSIDFTDDTKKSFLNLVPQSGGGNATVTTTKSTISVSSTFIGTSPFSGEDIDGTILDNADTITVIPDQPITAYSGQVYTKFTFYKTQTFSIWVGASNLAQITSSSQQSSGYPLGKSALNIAWARLAGRYQMTVQ